MFGNKMTVSFHATLSFLFAWVYSQFYSSVIRLVTKHIAESVAEGQNQLLCPSTISAPKNPTRLISWSLNWVSDVLIFHYLKKSWNAWDLLKDLQFIRGRLYKRTSTFLGMIHDGISIIWDGIHSILFHWINLSSLIHPYPLAFLFISHGWHKGEEADIKHGSADSPSFCNL